MKVPNYFFFFEIKYFITVQAHFTEKGKTKARLIRQIALPQCDLRLCFSKKNIIIPLAECADLFLVDVSGKKIW